MSKTTKEPVEGQEKDYEFRLLEADEIECRVGQGGNQKSRSWCSLLLYKDARCDMKRLDEKFGIFGWTRKHERIGDSLYCTISVYKEGLGWVSKQDVGTPSNTEAIKGEASDAFKRAAFCLGIGRELYTAPKIFINLSDTDYNQQQRLATTFHVSFIDYDNRKISRLIIVDNKEKIRYVFGLSIKDAETLLANNKADNGESVSVKEDEEVTMFKDYAYPQIEQAQTLEELERIWNDFPRLQGCSEFADKIIFRRIAISKTKEDLVQIYNSYPAYHTNGVFVQKLTEQKSKIA